MPNLGAYLAAICRLYFSTVTLYSWTPGQCDDLKLINKKIH